MYVQNKTAKDQNRSSEIPSVSPSRQKIQCENKSLQNCITWSGSGGTAEGALSKEEEYNEASQKVEIDHGSGIIVNANSVASVLVK